MYGIYLGFMFGLAFGFLFTQATYYNQDRKLVREQQDEIDDFSEMMNHSMSMADNEIHRLMNEIKILEKKLERENSKRLTNK